MLCSDFHGAFSETTGTNAPIYFQGWGEEDFDVHSCVENWLASGVSREKISKLLFQYDLVVVEFSIVLTFPICQMYL